MPPTRKAVTMTTTAISNSDDIIDSRNVIARIEELKNEIGDVVPGTSVEFHELRDELKVLEALVEEASDYAADWQYGETLIRATYFKEYAQELAEDIGAIKDNCQWPNDCIDWDQAASELQMDYTCIDFDGIDYWIR